MGRLFVSPDVLDIFVNRCARVEILDGQVMRLYMTVERPSIDSMEPHVDETVVSVVIPIGGAIEMVETISRTMGWADHSNMTSVVKINH